MPTRPRAECPRCVRGVQTKAETRAWPGLGVCVQVLCTKRHGGSGSSVKEYAHANMLCGCQQTPTPGMHSWDLIACCFVPLHLQPPPCNPPPLQPPAPPPPAGGEPGVHGGRGQGVAGRLQRHRRQHRLQCGHTQQDRPRETGRGEERLRPGGCAGQGVGQGGRKGGGRRGGGMRPGAGTEATDGAEWVSEVIKGAGWTCARPPDSYGRVAVSVPHHIQRITTHRRPTPPGYATVDQHLQVKVRVRGAGPIATRLATFALHSAPHCALLRPALGLV